MRCQFLFRQFFCLRVSADFLEFSDKWNFLLNVVVGFNSDCLTKVLCLSLKCSPWGTFKRDPTPYLQEFRGKPRKTPSGYVDKRDQELNLVPHV